MSAACQGCEHYTIYYAHECNLMNYCYKFCVWATFCLPLMHMSHPLLPYTPVSF